MNTVPTDSQQRDELRANMETAAQLRSDSAYVRLTLWTNWLSKNDLWSDSRAWEWVLDAAMCVGSADYANVQLVHPRLQGLELTAQRGFHPPFLKFFRFVTDSHSACGAALKRRRPVVVGDVTDSSIFARPPQLEVILDAGVRAVTSVPLIGEKGRMLGMLSVHYREPHGNKNGEVTGLKVLAHTIGLAIEKHATGAHSVNTTAPHEGPTGKN